MEKLKQIGSKRIMMSVVGVMLCAISVGIFKIAALGVDPFQSFMAGLDEVVPIKFGTLYVITNAVLLLFALIFDRHYIGIATFINLFLLGYITQFTLYLLNTAMPEPLFAVRVVFLVLGIAMICLALSLYMTADLGVSTYDAVALVMCNKWKIGKFRYDRIATDIVCIIFGICFYLLSGGKISDITSIVGVGTLITAFFMGPLIEVFNEHFSKPLLNGRKAKRKE